MHHPDAFKRRRGGGALELSSCSGGPQLHKEAIVTVTNLHIKRAMNVRMSEFGPKG